jgi:hypothetical protein
MNMTNLKKVYLFILLCFFSGFSHAQVGTPDIEIELDEEGFYEVEEAPVFNRSTRLHSKMINGKFALSVGDKLITEAIYDRVPVVMSNAFIVIEHGKYGVVNTKGKAVIQSEYDSIGSKYNYAGPRTYIVKKDALYGIYSLEGKEIHPIKYRKIYVANAKNILIVKNQQNKMEIISAAGKPIASNFDFAQLYFNVAFVYRSGKAAFITSSYHSGFIYDSLTVNKTYAKPSKSQRYGRQHYKKQHKQPYLVSSSKVIRIIVRNADSVGLVDTLNRILVPIEQSDIKLDRTRGYYVIQKNYKKGFRKGAYLNRCSKYIEPVYEVLYTDGMRYIEVRKDRKWGMIDDATGEMLIPCLYDNIYKTDTTFIVTLNGKKGVANKFGKILIPTEYDDIDNLGGFLSHEFDGVYKVRNDTLEGLVKYTGEVLIPVEYEWLSSFEERFIIVSKNDKYGLFSMQGELVQEARFNSINRMRTYSSEIFITITDEGYGALDLKGHVFLENKYQSMTDIYDYNWDLKYPNYKQKHDYLRLENKKGFCGVMDVNSAHINVPCVYKALYQYLDINNDTTYFLVKKGRKFGVVDQANNVIIDFKYDSLSFNKTNRNIYYQSKIQLCIVAKKRKKYGVINMNGETLIPFEYEGMDKLATMGLFKAKKDDYYILINQKNQVLNPGPFDEISEFSSGKALAFYQGRAKEINLKGAVVSKEMKMRPHVGYKTMYEVKMALIQALESTNDSALYFFAQKIAPSPQIIHFLMKHKKARDKVSYRDFDYIVGRYYKKLLEFKYYTWKRNDYFDRANLYVPDYTRFRDGLVTNFRTTDWAYDDTRILEKFLRNSIKVNGYWISSYFIHRNF